MNGLDGAAVCERMAGNRLKRIYPGEEITLSAGTAENPNHPDNHKPALRNFKYSVLH